MKNDHEKNTPEYDERVSALQLRATELEKAARFWEAKFIKTRDLIARFVNELTDRELSEDDYRRLVSAQAERIRALESRIVELSKTAEGDTKT